MTHSFPTRRSSDLDAMTTGQVTAIAVRADAERQLAGDRRTHPDLVDRIALQRIGPLLVDDGAGRNCDLVAARLVRITQGDAAQHAVAQRFEHVAAFHDRHRSEEHTSELQSLMRISYAVFCLKKKKIQTTTT